MTWPIADMATALPIPGDWLIQGGAVGLLAFVALMFFLGWLVPRKTVQQIERDRDWWRQVALKAMGHTELLLPAAQIASEVTRALSDVPRKDEQLKVEP